MACRWLILAGWASAVVLLTPTGAIAFIPRPAASYTVVTGGGEYVFVMLGPLGGAYYDDATNPESIPIRAMYPRSGMYQNNGSAELVWAFGTHDSYVYRVDLTVFPDGVHLAECSRLPADPDQPGIVFYARGEVVRAYTVRELVADPGPLYDGRSGLRYCDWLRRTGGDGERVEYTVETADGNRFVFDVRSGRVVSEYRPVRWGTVGWVIAGLAGAAAAAWAARRWYRRTAPAPKPAEPGAAADRGDIAGL